MNQLHEKVVKRRAVERKALAQSKLDKIVRNIKMSAESPAKYYAKNGILNFSRIRMLAEAGLNLKEEINILDCLLES